MAMILMKFGPLAFEVYPLNFHEAEHNTSTDYARKDILESSPGREWVGEGDEELILHGRTFPFHSRLGVRAKSSLDKLDDMRRAHQAHKLMRVDRLAAEPLGWFVLEKLDRRHEQIYRGGIGRVVTFDASFMRVDIPNAAMYLNAVQQITST